MYFLSDITIACAAYLVATVSPGPAILAIIVTSAGVAGAILVGCALLGVIVFGTYALAFSTDRMMRLYKAARRPIEGMVAALFGMAGMKLLTGRA